MALFSRQKKSSVLPEVDQYYEGTRRDRAGLAWLLAFVSIAVVALAIVGIFLGGRWVYREITKDDEPANVAVDTRDDVPSVDGGPEPSDAEPEAPAAADDGGNVQDDDELPAFEDESAAEGDDSDDTAAEVPRTGDDPAPAPLPSTGAGGLVAAFAGTSAAAGFTHHLVQRRRTRR